MNIVHQWFVLTESHNLKWAAVEWILTIELADCRLSGKSEEKYIEEGFAVGNARDPFRVLRVFKVAMIKHEKVVDTRKKRPRKEE
jgi:hypothetical protein